MSDTQPLVGEPVVEPVHPAVDEINLMALRAHEKRQYVTALTMMQRAIYIYPNSPSLWTNLGVFYLNLHQYEQAKECQLRAINLDGNYHIAWGNLGLTLQAMNQLGQAEAAYNTALLHKPDYPDALFNRSLLYLETGDFERGFAEYDSRILKRPKTYPKFPAPFWKGEDLYGKTIYVNYEQGIGDSILFARYLPILNDASYVYVCVPNDVASLLWHYTYCPRELIFIPERVPIPETDYSIYMGSLPSHTKVKVLSDGGQIKRRVQQQFETNPVQIPLPQIGTLRPFRVGICWSGNPEQDRNLDRQIPLESLVSALADDPRVFLVSLQVGPQSADIERIAAEDLIYDPTEELKQRGLVATGTAMMQLDLVITCCTSVAHLAAALDIPTIVVLPYHAYWVWGIGETSPWWPKVELYRQQSPGDWSVPLQQARQSLKLRLEE